MRLAVAIDWFDTPNGAATYAHVVTDRLARLGHDAAIVTPNPGAMAALAAGTGVRVLGPDGPPPDVVLPQDPMIAAELARTWPGVPQVYVAHGWTTDQGMPPTLPGLTAAVVAMNDRVAGRAAGHVAGGRVVRLRQPIDVDRFRPGVPLAERPRRVLLLGNYLHGARRQALFDACAAAGLAVGQLGFHGRPTVAPETEIGTADIVVGYGRAVLESMACGRAAYLLDDIGGDGWVTADAYPVLEADGFSCSALTTSATPRRFAADLAHYDPGMGAANRALILAHHAADDHARALVALCADVAGAPRTAPPPGADRLVREQWDAEWRLGLARTRLAVADEREAELEAAAAAAERAAADAEARLDALRSTRRHRVAARVLRPLDRVRGR